MSSGVGTSVVHRTVAVSSNYSGERCRWFEHSRQGLANLFIALQFIVTIAERLKYWLYIRLGIICKDTVERSC